MLTAVVTRGAEIQVILVQAEPADGEQPFIDCEFPIFDAEGQETGVCEEGPSPIAPEVKELAWGAGSFIVLAILMRFFLFPKLKAGMDARYAHIRDGHEQADTARAAAKAEVAQYESALATVKTEANERVDAARQTLEAERAARIGQANADTAAKREAAAAESRAAREAANADIAAAVASVTSRTVELSIGKAPDASVVSNAVNDAMSAGVGS